MQWVAEFRLAILHKDITVANGSEASVVAGRSLPAKHHWTGMDLACTEAVLLSERAYIFLTSLITRVGDNCSQSPGLGLLEDLIRWSIKPTTSGL